MNPTVDTGSAVEKMQDTIHRLRADIAAHPFCKGLRPEHLAALAECAMETRFAPGELIFRESEFANRFYFLLEGEVALEGRAKDGATPIEVIGAGDVLGWSWLYPPYYWHFHARALKPTRAIFFYGTWLREHCHQDHDFAFEMLTRMAQIMIARLQATRMQLSAALGRAPR